ncbi:MAG: glycosyltransferase family 2 protein [Acidobacteriota bacterium]
MGCSPQGEFSQMSFMVKLAMVAVVLAAAVVLSRWVPRHPRWRPVVIILNLLISVRYLWWRATQTLNWESGWGIAISLTVFCAEIYGFLVVLHHYTLAMRATDHQAPDAAAGRQPTVDVFITTYDEDVDILYRTIVGCQAMDYARKRIIVLDDGCRAAVEALCERLGASYLARRERAGAKAGNLNHGLSHSLADLIVTFDADHVPVRTFLSETVLFFQDREIAQVQTPHHFYNPDLFQDRLHIKEYIANEQDMFYHVVQPGRDVYNSSFYCGSGAVFRRVALQEIGGFPTSTITEDLHTSMLLHSRGWRSIYLNKDLSAGLAPESYGAYLTQRRRWARGTFQVMFAQKGLFLRRLSLMQRLNYFATLWYWLYGFPRVVYLAAPLFYLLFGLRPLVVGNLTDLLTYYLPHLAVSIVAFQLVNLGLRRIFWSDVYESSISMQVALAALTAPFSRKVTFSVTPKGAQAAAASPRETWRLSWPVWILAGAVLFGLSRGITSLVVGGIEQDGTLINSVWAAYNLVVLGFGLLLLKHRPHRRGAVRLARRLPCRLAWHGGQVSAETVDASETGLSFVLTPARSLPPFLDVTLGDDEEKPLTLRARLVRCDIDERGRLSAAVDFVDRTDLQHRRLVERLFCAPDAWDGPHGLTMGAPEHLARIVRSVAAIFSRPRVLRRLAPRFRCRLDAAILSADGSRLPATVVDVSGQGAALRLHTAARLPSPEQFAVTIAWNDVERTTFKARIRTGRNGAHGEHVLGIVFRDLDEQQRGDLRKHLYDDSTQRSAPRMAS